MRLENRVRKLEARLSGAVTDPNLHVRRAAFMAEVTEFVDAAWPDRSESIAHHVAMLLGLPDARALRQCLEGMSIEEIARDRYREDWPEHLSATAAKAGAACEAAHGAEWGKTFTAIWCRAD